MQKSCNMQAEQWKTTIHLPHMNLIIFPTSACPTSLFKHNKSIVVFHFSACMLQVCCNCIKQPQPKSYPTTDNSQNSCEQYDAFVVILSLRLLYLQDSGYYCKLFDVHARVTSFKDAWSVVTIPTRSAFSGCLMQLAKHNHCPFRLSASMVTTVVKTTNLFLTSYILPHLCIPGNRWFKGDISLPLALISLSCKL